MNNNSTYKRLGDYVREVDVRNTDLKINKLVGLTIAKAFIPSVANTIGTDLSKYKVIKENQFACSLMQVSRDGEMPIAVFKGEDAKMVEMAKAMIADKSHFTDCFKRADIMAEMQFQLIVIMSNFGYPPAKDNPEDVYSKVLEQAENFKKYEL